MKLAPICLFVYKRPQHTLKTIEALKKNYLASETDLFVFSDAAKKDEDITKVIEVRNLFENLDGFRKVHLIKSENNKGLAKSIISGVTQVINQYGKVIVLEDDLISSTNFLKFVNQCLLEYEDNKEIFSVSGYTFPIKLPNDMFDVYFGLRASSWGWATWIDRWQDIDWKVSDFDHFSNDKRAIKDFNKGGSDMFGMLAKQQKGVIDSWAIRWCYHQFKQKKYTVYPKTSKIQNIGFDKEATNTNIHNRFSTLLDSSLRDNFKLPEKVILNEQTLASFRDKFSLRARAIGRIKAYFSR